MKVDIPDSLSFWMVVMFLALLVGTGLGGCIWILTGYDVVSSTNETITVHSIPYYSEIMTNNGVLLYVDKYYSGRLLIDKTYNVTIETRRNGNKWITYCEDC